MFISPLNRIAYYESISVYFFLYSNKSNINHVFLFQMAIISNCNNRYLSALFMPPSSKLVPVLLSFFFNYFLFIKNMLIKIKVIAHGQDDDGTVM